MSIYDRDRSDTNTELDTPTDPGIAWFERFYRYAEWFAIDAETDESRRMIADVHNERKAWIKGDTDAFTRIRP